MAHSPPHLFTRRQALAGIVGIAGAAILAACGDTAGVSPTAGATTAPNTTSAPAAAPSPAGTVAPAATVAVAPVSAVGTLPNKLIEIDYWHHNTGASIPLFESFAANFNMQYAGKIKVTSIAQGNIATLNKKIRASATGGGLPGATMADDYDVTQYAFSKIIVPLDSYIEDAQYGLTKDQRNDFLPNQIGRHKLAIYGNQTMAFPQGFSAFAAAWNVDALAKAGFSGPPKTWKEFPDHVRAVAKANPGMAGWITLDPGARFMSVMITYGLDWLTPDGKSSTFDRPEALEIMTWWKQLYDEKLLMITKDPSRDLFVAQKTAYDMESSGSISSAGSFVKDFKWSGGLPPQGSANGTLSTETYGPVNVVPKNDPEKQLAGWLWLKYLVTPDPLAQWVKNIGYFPSTKSLPDSPNLQDFYAQNPVAGKLAKEVAPNARILTPSPALTEVRGSVVANAVDEVFSGQLTPEAGVKKMKAEADKAIRNALQS